MECRDDRFKEIKVGINNEAWGHGGMGARMRGSWEVGRLTADREKNSRPLFAGRLLS